MVRRLNHPGIGRLLMDHGRSKSDQGIGAEANKLIGRRQIATAGGAAVGFAGMPAGIGMIGRTLFALLRVGVPIGAAALRLARVRERWRRGDAKKHGAGNDQTENEPAARRQAVERRGIEPRFAECDSAVIPLDHRPGIPVES